MVIPSINCPNFLEAEKRIRQAELLLLPGEGWIHIDVSDGKFSETTSWGSPEELKSIKTDLNVEVHLMIQDPESVIESWLDVGVKRVVVHLQSIKNPRFILDICKKYGAEAVLSFDPSTPIENGIPYLKDFSFFQVLSVSPGPSGQKFLENSIDKIRALRERAPTATIEVDGGIDELTVKLARAAGADILVSGNYIFGNPNPSGAYEKLRALYENSV